MLNRCAALRGWQRLVLAFLAGAMTTAGHAPVNLPWALFLSVPLLTVLLVSAPRPAQAAWVGWAAGFGYFVTGLHWIGHAFLVDPDRFALLLPLGVAALPAGLAVFWALAFWLARWLTLGPLQGAVALVGTWTAVEVARTHMLTGFPWVLLGYVWIETPVMQAAAWIGPHGMTLLTLLVTALPGIALLTRTRQIAFPLGCACLLGAVFLAGSLRLGAEAEIALDAPVLRVVQPNAPQHLKWKPGHRDEFYARAVAATRAPGDVDLIIWPETAMYYLPARNPEEMVRLGGVTGGAPLISGALHVEATGARELWYNSLFVLMPDGQLTQRYDKHHLVPFGEYLPLPWLLEVFGLEKFGIGGGFGRGPGPQTMQIPGLPSFSPLICYEAIFPHEIVARARPDWLLQITNDAWFGNFAGPQQHLAQARIRAIEQGLPLVRAANTGISAVIDAHGRVRESLDLGAYGYVDASLPGKLGPTIYARVGDWPAYLVLLCVLGGVSAMRLRHPSGPEKV